VEKLAVTSPFVFTGQSFWPENKSLESVRPVIKAARMTSPLLINFKRNAETFFLPSLSNLAALSFQLDKYIQITKQICERMEERFVLSFMQCSFLRDAMLIIYTLDYQIISVTFTKSIKLKA